MARTDYHDPGFSAGRRRQRPRTADNGGHAARRGLRGRRSGGGKTRAGVARAVALRRGADRPDDARDVGRRIARESARRLSGQPGGGADRARDDRQRGAGDEDGSLLLPHQADRSRDAGDDGGEGGGARESAAGESAAETAARRQVRNRGNYRAGSSDT